MERVTYVISFDYETNSFIFPEEVVKSEYLLSEAFLAIMKQPPYPRTPTDRYEWRLVHKGVTSLGTEVT